MKVTKKKKKEQRIELLLLWVINSIQSKSFNAYNGYNTSSHQIIIRFQKNSEIQERITMRISKSM